MDRRSRTVSAIFWSGITTWGQQILTIILMVVLARLLDPAQFGIVALAGVFVFFVVEIIRSVVTQTLVQVKEADDLHFTSVFWLLLGVSTLAAVAFALLADPIAAHFGEPILSRMVPWMSLVIVLTAAEIVQEAWLMRDLRFRPLAVRSAVSTIISGIVAVSMAVYGFGAWSMLTQQIVYAVVACIMAWYFSPWRPSFRLSLSHCRLIFGIGRNIGLFGIISFLVDRIDVFIIGTFLGSTAVGLYNVGMRVIRLLLSGVVGSIVRALLPALSQLQDDVEAFKRAYLQAYQFSVLVALPLFVGVAVLSEEIVAVLLGPKWHESSDLMAVIALAGIIQSIGMLQWTGLMARGRFSSMLKITVFSPLLHGGCMTAGFYIDGLFGIAVGYLIASWCIDTTAIVVMARSINVSLRAYTNIIFPIIFSAFVMTVVILGVRTLLSDHSSFVILLVCTPLAAVTYVGSMLLMGPSIVGNLKDVITDTLARRRALTV